MGNQIRWGHQGATRIHLGRSRWNFTRTRGIRGRGGEHIKEPSRPIQKEAIPQGPRIAASPAAEETAFFVFCCGKHVYFWSTPQAENKQKRGDGHSQFMSGQSTSADRIHNSVVHPRKVGHHRSDAVGDTKISECYSLLTEGLRHRPALLVQVTDCRCVVREHLNHLALKGGLELSKG